MPPQGEAAAAALPLGGPPPEAVDRDKGPGCAQLLGHIPGHDGLADLQRGRCRLGLATTPLVRVPHAHASRCMHLDAGQSLDIMADRPRRSRRGRRACGRGWWTAISTCHTNASRLELAANLRMLPAHLVVFPRGAEALRAPHPRDLPALKDHPWLAPCALSWLRVWSPQSCAGAQQISQKWASYVGMLAIGPHARSQAGWHGPHGCAPVRRADALTGRLPPRPPPLCL